MLWATHVASGYLYCMITAHCPLPTAHCPLPTAYCLLPTVAYSQPQTSEDPRMKLCYALRRGVFYPSAPTSGLRESWQMSSARLDCQPSASVAGAPSPTPRPDPTGEIDWRGRSDSRP